MTAPLRWPAKSLLIADAISIVAGFVVFRALCSSWPAHVFAGWEWLRVASGLCLLLPRNGLDIVAQRSAVRHPGHLQEWTAIGLIVRTPLAMLASGIFVSIARHCSEASSSLAILLALGLPFQALVPDLAARVQGRYALAGLLQMARNLVPAIAVLVAPITLSSPVNLAAVMAFAEVSVAVCWWVDSARNGGLPGGRWIVLLRRGGRAMARRSMDQTLSRWLRVMSWNADAFLLGLLTPGLWATIAPARSLMMSAVFPIANYLGALSPLLARESQSAVRGRFRLATRTALAAGSAMTMASMAFAPLIVTTLFGPRSLVDRETLVVTTIRFAPIVILLCATSFWTTLRRDDLSLTVPAAHLGLCCGLILAGASLGAPSAGYFAFLAGEWVLGIICVSRFTWASRGESGAGRVGPALLRRIQTRMTLDFRLSRSDRGAHADA